MEEFGNFEDQNPVPQTDNLNFGDGDDAFASAGPDPFASAGLSMNSQEPVGMSAAPGTVNFNTESDYTPEEIALVEKARADQDERKRLLYESQMQEEQDKQQRKLKGKELLDKWKNEQDQQTAGRRVTNQQEAEQYKQSMINAKNSNNPWIRVVDNCEMNPNQYIGSKDVTRMRQAMIARKSDITKKGGLKKAL